jgi:hypothetical protein
VLPKNHPVHAEHTDSSLPNLKHAEMVEKPEKPRVPDYYAALGVSRDATSVVVKRAYRELALKYHPDRMAPGETIDAVLFREVRLQPATDYIKG